MNFYTKAVQTALYEKGQETFCALVSDEQNHFA